MPKHKYLTDASAKERVYHKIHFNAVNNCFEFSFHSPILGGGKNYFVFFSKALALSEKQTASSKV